VDAGEPGRVAEAAARLALRYVVLTGVARDDLADGGASHFAATVAAVRAALPGARVEVLTTDFKGDPRALATLLAAAPVAGGNFSIQVGAFKDRASAEAIVARLKGKGFAAFVVTPEGEGLFNVRVGTFADRGEAEKVQARLRDDEKFKPFIVSK
jgi:cell division septation protein DedD